MKTISNSDDAVEPITISSKVSIPCLKTKESEQKSTWGINFELLFLKRKHDGRVNAPLRKPLSKSLNYVINVKRFEQVY